VIDRLSLPSLCVGACLGPKTGNLVVVNVAVSHVCSYGSCIQHSSQDSPPPLARVNVVAVGVLVPRAGLRPLSLLVLTLFLFVVLLLFRLCPYC
jgi:hypothetical protein